MVSLLVHLALDSAIDQYYLAEEGVALASANHAGAWFPKYTQPFVTALVRFEVLKLPHY